MFPDSAVTGVARWLLYTLRVGYLILGGGIAAFFWPNLLNHSPDFVEARGIQFALLSGLGVVAFVGLRYPLRMLPILLFELTWKALYLLAYALLLWRAHQITHSLQADIFSLTCVVVFLPLIPWTYVWRNYVVAPADRWR